ncbi:MAG: MarR family transcriptional regulator [Actinomycetota bacterium]
MIRLIMRTTFLIFHDELEKHQVTLPQFHALKALRARGEVRVTELSEFMMISAPTASRMIDGMVAKGLLAKDRDPSDHRVALIRLTEKSDTLLADLLAQQNELMAQVFEGESTEELERTVRHLGAIGRHWSEISEEKASGREGK